MAYDSGPSLITAEAGQDLSTKQYFFGTIAADGQVDPSSAAAYSDGVIYGKPDAAGKAFPFATHPGDIVKVVAGASITKGDLLEVDSGSAGRAITTSSGKIVAKALAAATAAGDIIPALLILSRST